MLVRGLVTTVPDDDPVPNGTEGQIRTLNGNTLVATVTTTDGWWEYEMNGSPGPFRVFWDYADVVRNSYSKVTGPSGPTDVASIPLLFRAFANGVIDGIANNMACSASGSNMNVGVNTGAALVQGIIYDHRFASTLTVTTAHASLPRIDTIVVEVVPPGAGEDVEGRSVVKIIAGTPASTPAAPALTQTSALYQIPLYNIAVGAAVTVIGSDKLTDRRSYARGLIPAGSITPTQLSNDALAIYAVKESGSTVNVNPINRFNFNGAHFNVSLNESFSGRQVDIDLASGGGTGRALFMPGSEFVATGPLSSGSRTVITMGVGPLPANVQYAVSVWFTVTVRNQINTGTVSTRVNIDGGTNRTHEYQNVGGVPRLMQVVQSGTVTKNPGASFNVVGSVQYISGDPSDIRAGWVHVIAIPNNVLVA